MEGVTPTMYPFGMSCKEFTGANEGVSFSQFYFISTACKSDHFVLSITWAFIIVDLIAVRSHFLSTRSHGAATDSFRHAACLYISDVSPYRSRGQQDYGSWAHLLVLFPRFGLYVLCLSFNIANACPLARVVGLLLTLYAVASPIRMFFMTLPLIFTFVSGSVLEFNWLKVMARTDWSRIVGPGVKRDMFKTSMILCCVVFSVVLTGAWAIAPPILRALGYSAHDINISVWVGFVWIALSVWIFLCLTVMSIRKLVGGLSGMVHHAETSGTGEVPDAVLSLLKKVRRRLFFVLFYLKLHVLTCVSRRSSLAAGCLERFSSLLACP